MSPMNIGVIDTFIDHTHPDLDAENIGNIDFLSLGADIFWRDFIARVASLSGQVDPNENALLEQFQHGTHVSGIFEPTHDNDEGISGVFPYAHIIGISTHWNKNEHSQEIDNIGSYFSNRSDFYMEMFYFLYMRSQNVHIINMSLGYTEKVQKKYLELAEAEWDNLIAEATTNVGLGRFFHALRDLHYDFVLVLAAGNETLDAKAPFGLC